MARLPEPGGDKGKWGTLLNEFLSVEHNQDGSLKTSGTIGNLAPLNNPTFTGSVTVPSPVDNTDAANKAYVDSVATSGAPLADGTTPGLVQLTGDLGGTAASPTVPGLADKADSDHTHDVADISDFATQVTNHADVSANTADRHNHNNQDVLDATTASFTTEEKTKLDGIENLATANSSDSTLLDRSNHTGNQAISTVTGLQSALDSKLEEVDIADINATGTADNTTYLRGDGSWETVPIGGSSSWGDLSGELSNQTDLQEALDEKAAEADVQVNTAKIAKLNAHSGRDTDLELRKIRADLADIENGKVAKIVVLGDSISRQPTWMQMARDLSYIYNKYPMPVKAGRRSTQTDVGGSTSDRLWDNRNGTWLHPTTGSIPPGGTDLAAGQEVSHTTYCDRFMVRTISGSGDYDVYVDGNHIANVPAGGGGLSTTYTSPPLPYDSHTVRLVAGSSGAKFDVTYFYAGNYSEGLQVWDLGWSGGRTKFLFENNFDPVLGSPNMSTLSFVQSLNPSAIIIAFGTNDAGQTDDPTRLAEYDTESRKLINWIRDNVSSNPSIIMWVPPGATTRDFWPKVQAVAQQIREDLGVVMIDSFEQLGMAADATGLDLVPDGTHPGPRSQPLISELVTSRLITRRTPIYNVAKDPTWFNITEISDIDMGYEYIKATLSGEWEPGLIRATSPNGEVRKTRMLIRSNSGSSITFPGNITWTSAFPSLSSGEWVLTELTQIPDAGILGEIIGTGNFSVDVPFSSVDWLALYKASDVSGVGEGNSLVTWNDASGNNLNLTPAQGVNSVAPTYTSSYANFSGQPAVVFSGTDGVMRSEFISPNIPPSYSLVLIIDYGQLTTQRVVSHVSGAGRGYGLQAVGTQVWQGGSTSDTRVSGPASAVSTGQAMLVEVFADDDAASRIDVNGVEVASGTVVSQVINTITIGGTGSSPSAQNLFKGAISFVGYIAGDHASNADWQVLRAALANKHGISLQ